MCRTNLIAIAFIMSAMLIFNKSIAQKGNAKDTVITFHNNSVTLHHTNINDIDKVTDPVTGSIKTVSVVVDEPLFVSGVPVHKEAVPYKVSEKLERSVIAQIRNSTRLRSLPDGKVQVRLRNIVLTRKGEVAYYELANAKYTDKDGTRTLSADDVLTYDTLANSIGQLSIKLNEQYTLLHIDLSNGVFTIKGGHVTFDK